MTQALSENSTCAAFYAPSSVSPRPAFHPDDPRQRGNPLIDKSTSGANHSLQNCTGLSKAWVSYLVGSVLAFCSVQVHEVLSGSNLLLFYDFVQNLQFWCF